MPNEPVQSYNLRFRQQLNELKYAVQNEHSNVTARKIASRIEEKYAIKKYIMNLRDEIGSQIRPLKPSTQNGVQQEALEAEIWYRKKHQNRQRTQNTQPNITRRPRPQIQAGQFNKNLSSTLRNSISCNFCKLQATHKINVIRKGIKIFHKDRVPSDRPRE